MKTEQFHDQANTIVHVRQYLVGLDVIVTGLVYIKKRTIVLFLLNTSPQTSAVLHMWPQTMYNIIPMH